MLVGIGIGTAVETARAIPKMSQETLAEMIGTTRSRVSFFMNRFRTVSYTHLAAPEAAALASFGKKQ